MVGAQITWQLDERLRRLLAVDCRARRLCVWALMFSVGMWFIAMWTALAMPLVHLQGFRIKGFLLLWGQGGVEGFGGLVALLHMGLHGRVALAVHGLHGVDALGRGHGGKGLAVNRGRALASGWVLRLHGRGVGGPSSFLASVQFECGLERLHALFHTGFTRFRVCAVMAVAWGCLGLFYRRGGRGCLCLRKRRHGQSGKHGGNDGAALQERHGEFLSVV